MTITIKSRIHESCTGRGVHTQATYNTNPRNLMRAIDAVGEIRGDMTRGWGNIGHCGTWIEIDGVALNWMDENELSRESNEEAAREYRRNPYSSKPETRTEIARSMIDKAQSGELVAERKALEASLDEDARLEQAAYDAGYAGLPMPDIHAGTMARIEAEYHAGCRARKGDESVIAEIE